MRQPDDRGGSRHILIADSGGLIDQLALCLPASFLRSRGAADWFKPLLPIGNLLNAMPAGVDIYLLVDRECLADATVWANELAAPSRMNIVTMADSDPAIESPWLQDTFHVRVRAEYDPTPTDFLTLRGKLEGSRLAAVIGMTAQHAGVDLQGGNQLVGDDFRLVGQHDLVGDGRENLEDLDHRVIRSFGYRVGDLNRAGPSSEAGDRLYQFGFHIDQFVSVTGVSRGGRPLLLVAEPVLVENSVIPMVEDARKRLDASAIFLQLQGFEVQRNPVPWVVAPDSGKRLPRLYNNVIVENEIRRGKRKPLVWLPQFSDVEPLEGFDGVNREIWEQLGFEVAPIFGWTYFASRNGAIRCVSKVLKRSPKLIEDQFTDEAGRL